MSSQLTFLSAPVVPKDVVREKTLKAFIAWGWGCGGVRMEWPSLADASVERFGHFQNQPRELNRERPMPRSRFENKDR